MKFKKICLWFKKSRKNSDKLIGVKGTKKNNDANEIKVVKIERRPLIIKKDDNEKIV